MVAGGRRRSSGKRKIGKRYGGSPKEVERSEAWGGRKRSALKGKKQCGWLPRGLGESRAGRPRRQNVSRILRRAAGAALRAACPRGGGGVVVMGDAWVYRGYSRTRPAAGLSTLKGT